MTNVAQTTYKLNPFSEPLSAPPELASRRNWICWRADPDYGKDGKLKPKPKKTPIIVGPGTSSAWQRPENHVSYDEAVAAVQKHNLSGVGFVLTPGCGLIGGDLDGCRDPVTGVIEPWAQAIIDRRETYFEVSPSGRGVRFWTTTDLPLRKSENVGGIELYFSGRFLTFSGDHIAGTPWEIGRAPYAMDMLMKHIADAKAAAAAALKITAAGQAPAGSFEEKAGLEAYRKSPMGQINEAAMKDFDVWVPELLPSAEKTAAGGYRVKSRDLDRPLEEDLSLSPDGIKDFGVHDLGDPREGKRSPIDVVMEWSDPPRGLEEAAEWLGVRVGVPFDGPNTGSSGASPGPDPPMDIFDAGDEQGGIEPRQWLLGTTFCRGYLSGLTSAGGSGKTTVRILQALSLACGRALSGEHVFVRSRVMIVCLEDDLKELRRRVLAARLHHSVSAAEVKGWLFLTTPRRLKIAELDARGKKIVTGGLYRALVKAVDDLSLDLAVIDPAIKAHGLDESSNPEIDAFAGILTDLAVEKNIGIDLLSHERKGLAGAGKTVGDAERGRGASSLKDAMRLAKTLTVMSEKEALDHNVPDTDRRFMVRIDDAKVNIAPPSAATDWMRIVGVALGNGNSTYPSGDNVQACEKWTATAGVFRANVAQDTLWAAQVRGVRIRRGGQGARHDDTAATILGRTLGWSPPQAKKAVAKLVEDKLAIVVESKDDKGHEIPFLEIVEPVDINPF